MKRTDELSFDEIISQISHSRIFVRENIDYSRMETHKPGYIAKAVDLNDEFNTAHKEFKTLDAIYSYAKQHGFMNEIVVSVDHETPEED